MDNQSCASSGYSELDRVSSGWITSPVLPLDIELGRVSSGWITSSMLPLEILSWVECPQDE